MDSNTYVVVKCINLLDHVPNGTREVEKAKLALQTHAKVINNALNQNKNVFICCNRGRSRSPSAILSFFIIFRWNNLSNIESDSRVKEFKKLFTEHRPRFKRPIPNLDRFIIIQQMFLAEKTALNDIEKIGEEDDDEVEELGARVRQRLDQLRHVRVDALQVLEQLEQAEEAVGRVE